jgi:hypothetical protein
MAPLAAAPAAATLELGSRETTRRRDTSFMAFRQMIPCSRRWRVLCGAAAVGLAVALAGLSAAAQSWQSAIDYTKLQTRLGGQIPVGVGGLLSMAEGQSPVNSGAYYVNTALAEFSGAADPSLTPVQLTDGSGNPGAGVSNHATAVATYFFGDQTSMAKGANQVVLYEAGHWLTGGGLHYNTSAPPEEQNYRVQNHSWIVYTLGSSSNDLSALRRFDHVIDAEEMTAVVGANNYIAAVQHHPALFAHSYNAIVVGRSDSFHSRGTTGVHTGTIPGQTSPSQYGAAYGAGRYRPDIVAPLPVTSHTSPMVGSAAAMLHEVVSGTDASRSETMKAILLAGATKQEFATFDDPLVPGVDNNPWDRTPTRPLDDIFGAGELNVYNSYLIQLGGQYAGSQTIPTTIVGSYGWDYQDHKGDAGVGDIYYNFEVPEGSSAEELSIILSWNAKVTDTTPAPGTFTPIESLQNLNLRFYDSSDAFMGSLIDESISTVDNVEHIYQTDLQPGTYTLKVSGAADWDFGLAWRMTTKFDQISADFDEDGDVDGSDFLTWQKNLGKLLGATHGEGDADGDGDVDSEDLIAVQGRALPLPLLAADFAQVSAAAIPEPSTLALAVGTLLAAGWNWRRGRRG